MHLLGTAQHALQENVMQKMNWQRKSAIARYTNKIKSAIILKMTTNVTGPRGGEISAEDAFNHCAAIPVKIEQPTKDFKTN
jgi:hypothetical protein